MPTKTFLHPAFRILVTMTVTVALCYGSPVNGQHLSQDVGSEVGSSHLRESDENPWMLLDTREPYFRLAPSSLEDILRIRNGGEANPFKRTEHPSSPDLQSNNNLYHKRFGHILHQALREGDSSGRDITLRSNDEGNNSSPSYSSWKRNVSKRGIGLFSLAVALAQNNAPAISNRPKMQPADLSTYPRRARFFVATMG